MIKFEKFLMIFVILIIAFSILLISVSMFPSSAIKENVKNSSKTLSDEGNRKRCYIFNKFQYQEFDNYSDALMINTAYSIDSKRPIYSAFTAKKNYIPGVTETIEEDNIGELRSNSQYDMHNEVDELADTVNGTGTESFEYAKYWHGYLIILRPLLLFLDYQQIRVLMTFILAILAIFVTTSIAEKKNNIIATFYLLSLVFVEYFYIGFSLINSITFLITMIASLVIVNKFKEIKNWDVLFFAVGIFAGFFTLFDTPLLIVGSMLILYFLFKDGDGKGDFKDFIKLSLAWFLGYFLTWMTKWIFMDLMYHRTLFKTAIGQILYRSIGGFNPVLPILAVCINLLSMAIPIILTILIVNYFWIRHNGSITKETRKKGRIFAVIGIMPFLWYLIFSNHSTNHFFFTYRLLFISMFSILLWSYYICGEKGIRDEE